MAEFDRPTVAAGAGAGLAIDQDLRAYMLKVYNYMGIGLVVTGLVAYFTYTLSFVEQAGRIVGVTALGDALYNSPLQWVVMLAPLAFVLVLSFGINKLSTGAAQALFWVYAAVMGLSMSTIFLAFTASSIATTFFATAAAFLGLSLYGYTTKKDLSGFGTFLIMGVVGILVAMVINMFVQSSALSLAISVIGVLLFAGLTAYDTQKIKSMYFYVRGTDFVGKSVIMGALTLYLDFVNMFTFLLNLMGNRE